MNYIDPTGHQAERPGIDWDYLKSLIPDGLVTPDEWTCGWDVPAGCVGAVNSWLRVFEDVVSNEAQRRGASLTPGQIGNISEVILAQIAYESSFDPQMLTHATNSDGSVLGTAVGLMQVFVNRGASYDAKVASLLDPASNVVAGVGVWFDKFSMVDYNATRIWEAVNCYVGCKMNSDGTFGPNSHIESQLYVPRVVGIWKHFWVKEQDSQWLIE